MKKVIFSIALATIAFSNSSFCKDTTSTPAVASPEKISAPDSSNAPKGISCETRDPVTVKNNDNVITISAQDMQKIVSALEAEKSKNKTESTKPGKKGILLRIIGHMSAIGKTSLESAAIGTVIGGSVAYLDGECKKPHFSWPVGFILNQVITGQLAQDNEIKHDGFAQTISKVRAISTYILVGMYKGNDFFKNAGEGFISDIKGIAHFANILPKSVIYHTTKGA